MSSHEPVAERLERLREATEGLRPPEALMGRLQRTVSEFAEAPPVWTILAARSRMLVAGAVAVAAAALLIAWQAEARLDDRLASASYVLMEVSP